VGRPIHTDEQALRIAQGTLDHEHGCPRLTDDAEAHAAQDEAAERAVTTGADHDHLGIQTASLGKDPTHR
jgi:hypothetical protein